MWPRIVEVLLGAWLATSPFVFDVSLAGASWSAVTGGVLVAACSIAAWAPRFSGARYLTLVAAVGIAGAVYFASPHPATPFQQSTFLTAVLLAMFAIIPNACNRPPRNWL